MNAKKGTRFLGILAMLSVLFMLATSGIMQGNNPVKTTCREEFPTLLCINGGCDTENYWTEWCRIWGCVGAPLGYVECWPKN